MDESDHWDPHHKMNSALTVLSLRVQMLRRKAPEGGKLRRRLDEIADAVKEVESVSASALSGMGKGGSDAAMPEPVGYVGIGEQAEKPHVAVINDDTTFLRLMDELLAREEGYRVSTSFVGSEAYLFVRDLQPDLVVLDLVFGGDAELGWRTLDLLTLDPATRHIPVIVCSAATVKLQDHSDLLARFDVEVLPKPFDLDTLLEMISRTLGMSRAGTTISSG